MLLLEHLMHFFIGEPGLGNTIGIRGGVLADAASADEDLGLEKQVVGAGLALHVIDGTRVLDIGIEAKDHLFANRSSFSITLARAGLYAVRLGGVIGLAAY
jgi:hypothetical protein